VTGSFYWIWITIDSQLLSNRLTIQSVGFVYLNCYGKVFAYYEM